MKIGDLGDIKHLLDSFQAVSESRGTYAHMSPEMIKGTTSSHLGVLQKTDIWSFGCVLIEMLTGQLPQFINRQTQNGVPMLYTGRGCEMPIMFFVGRGGRPEILDTWPEAMKNVIDRCLDCDTQNRPSAMELLESSLIKGTPPIWSRGGLLTTLSMDGGQVTFFGFLKLIFSSFLSLRLSPCPSFAAMPEKTSNFTVIKAIAFGSYGMVYHVKMQDGTETAMKMVSLDPVDKVQKSEVTAVQNIMKTLMTLKHENVISHFYSGSMDNSPLSNSRHFYISMELCHGTSSSLVRLSSRVEA
jgi:serine/threonine protein kinase